MDQIRPFLTPNHAILDDIQGNQFHTKINRDFCEPGNIAIVAYSIHLEY